MKRILIFSILILIANACAPAQAVTSTSSETPGQILIGTQAPAPTEASAPTPIPPTPTEVPTLAPIQEQSIVCLDCMGMQVDREGGKKAYREYWRSLLKGDSTGRKWVTDSAGKKLYTGDEFEDNTEFIKFIQKNFGIDPRKVDDDAVLDQFFVALKNSKKDANDTEGYWMPEGLLMPIKVDRRERSVVLMDVAPGFYAGDLQLSVLKSSDYHDQVLNGKIKTTQVATAGYESNLWGQMFVEINGKLHLKLMMSSNSPSDSVYGDNPLTSGDKNDINADLGYYNELNRAIPFFIGSYKKGTHFDALVLFFGDRSQVYGYTRDWKPNEAPEIIILK